jgi:hypothetical protein
MQRRSKSEPLVVPVRSPLSSDLLRLFSTDELLWSRVHRAVAAALPEGVEPFASGFTWAHVLGAGYWGFAYQTVVPRWVVKITSDRSAGQVAMAVMRHRRLHKHPGICFFLAAWEVPDVVLSLHDGRRLPITVLVREELSDVPDRALSHEELNVLGEVDEYALEYAAASTLTRDRWRYPGQEAQFAREAVKARNEYRSALIAARDSLPALCALTDFCLHYLSATTEAITDVLPDNLGLRLHDMRDVGGVDDSVFALRDAEDCHVVTPRHVPALPK